MTEDRPDEGSVLFDVFMVAQQVGTALTKSLDGTGLSPVDYAIYSYLSSRSEPIRPTELAERLSIRPSTLTGYLTTMTERGHLRRIRNPSDGRSALIELSPEGRAAHRAADASATRTHRALERELGASYARIRGAIAELSTALDAVNRAG